MYYNDSIDSIFPCIYITCQRCYYTMVTFIAHNVILYFLFNQQKFSLIVNFGKCVEFFSFVVEIHMMSKVQNTLACDECGKILKTQVTLKLHKLLHAEKQHHCETCNKSFYYIGQLRRHNRLRLCFPEHKCQLCPGKFVFIRQLEKHLKVKHGPKLFKCELETCEKTFTSRAGLKLHGMTHAGLKPFACENCGKTFTQKGNMKSHSYIHSDYKRFKCELCEKKFTQIAGLLTHQYLHSAEHKATLIRPKTSVDKKMT